MSAQKSVDSKFARSANGIPPPIQPATAALSDVGGLDCRQHSLSVTFCAMRIIAASLFVIGLATAGTAPAGDAAKSLTNSSGAKSSNILGWEVTAQSRTNVPGANGHISVRFKPKNVSVKGRFLFLVDIRTNGALRFSVTVAPNASVRSPRVAAHLMLSDGAGMMAREELKDLHGSGDAFRYEFQAAPSLLANSRFVLQDWGRENRKTKTMVTHFGFTSGISLAMPQGDKHISPIEL